MQREGNFNLHFFLVFIFIREYALPEERYFLIHKTKSPFQHLLGLIIREKYF